MLHKTFEKEQGFTLIELLIVILIIGILAAIALPTFLGQQKKGQDAAAKSDVRNAVSEMQSCYTETQDFSTCPKPDTPLAPDVTTPVLHVGDYEVAAKSASGTTFMITRSAGGVYTRTCDNPGVGACKAADASGNQW